MVTSICWDTNTNSYIWNTVWFRSFISIQIGLCFGSFLGLWLLVCARYLLWFGTLCMLYKYSSVLGLWIHSIINIIKLCLEVVDHGSTVLVFVNIRISWLVPGSYHNYFFFHVEISSSFLLLKYHISNNYTGTRDREVVIWEWARAIVVSGETHAQLLSSTIFDTVVWILICLSVIPTNIFLLY